jgi:hypothetical protein
VIIYTRELSKHAIEGHVSTAFIGYSVNEGARLTEYMGWYGNHGGLRESFFCGWGVFVCDMQQECCADEGQGLKRWLCLAVNDHSDAAFIPIGGSDSDRSSR